MPIEYEQDNAKRLVIVTVTDPVSFDDLLDVIDRQAAEHAWDYAFLYDLRKSTMERTAAQMQQIVARVHQVGHGRPRGPVGVAIAPRPERVLSTLAHLQLTLGQISFEMLLTPAQIQDWSARNCHTVKNPT